MKLMIIGYARHGKDTVADIFTNTFGLAAISSSYAAAQHVMVPFFAKKGIVYPSLEACFEDRVNHRQDWYEQIKAFNTPDKTRLARQIYATSDIYVGMRSDDEYDATKAAGLFDYSIWVDRSKHIPPESTASNTISPSKADYVIDNNGTLQQLEIRTRSLYWDLISLNHAAELRN
jgi:hypothetical protein